MLGRTTQSKATYCQRARHLGTPALLNNSIFTHRKTGGRCALPAALPKPAGWSGAFSGCSAHGPSYGCSTSSEKDEAHVVLQKACSSAQQSQAACPPAPRPQQHRQKVVEGTDHSPESRGEQQGIPAEVSTPTSVGETQPASPDAAAELLPSPAPRPTLQQPLQCLRAGRDVRFQDKH